MLLFRFKDTWDGATWVVPLHKVHIVVTETEFRLCGPEMGWAGMFRFPIDSPGAKSFIVHCFDNGLDIKGTCDLGTALPE